jgi:hypothetical protein
MVVGFLTNIEWVMVHLPTVRALEGSAYEPCTNQFPLYRKQMGSECTTNKPMQREMCTSMAFWILISDDVPRLGHEHGHEHARRVLLPVRRPPRHYIADHTQRVGG